MIGMALKIIVGLESEVQDLNADPDSAERTNTDHNTDNAML